MKKVQQKSAERTPESDRGGVAKAAASVPRGETLAVKVVKEAGKRVQTLFSELGNLSSFYESNDDAEVRASIVSLLSIAKGFEYDVAEITETLGSTHAKAAAE